MNRTYIRVYQVLFSISLLPLWGLGLLSAQTASPWSVFFTFVGTFVLLERISFLQRRDWISKLTISVGPVFYLLLSILIASKGSLLTFPILWIFILFIFTLHANIDLVKKLILVFLYSAIYAGLIYPTTKLGVSLIDDSEEIEINLSHNLFDFEFINFDYDTVRIESNEKPILIETWNESCPPCLSSIKNLQDTLDSFDEIIDHYYLYQFKGASSLYQDKVMNFEAINNKRIILIDIENSLFDSLGLESYPYFLLFGHSGRLKSYRKGYANAKKNKIIEEIKQMIESESAK